MKLLMIIFICVVLYLLYLNYKPKVITVKQSDVTSPLDHSLVIKENLAIPPSIVCIGFFCLPNNPSNTSLVPGLRAPADINADPHSVTTLSNVVLLTKKSGTLNKASEGLSILNPLGMSAVFNAFSTHLSASRSLIVLPGLAVA